MLPLLTVKKAKSPRLSSKTAGINYDAGYILKQLKMAELNHIP